MLWQFFSLPGIENGIEYRYFSRYRIEVRNSSIVTTLVYYSLAWTLIFGVSFVFWDVSWMWLQSSPKFVSLLILNTYEHKGKYLKNVLVLVCSLSVWSHFSLGTNSHYYLIINYIFCNIKLLICCLFVVSKIIVKFKYEVGCRDLKYGNAERGLNE